MPAKQKELFEFKAPPREKPLELWVTINPLDDSVELEWVQSETNLPRYDVKVACTDSDEIIWDDSTNPVFTPLEPAAISATLEALRKRFETKKVFFGQLVETRKGWHQLDPPSGTPPWQLIENAILNLARKRAAAILAERFDPDPTYDSDPANALWLKKLRREEEAARELQRRIAEGARRIALKEREKKEERRSHARAASRADPAGAPAEASSPQPMPPIPLTFDLAPVPFQETMLALESLKGFFLRETASRWWISNQSDDLLCLPHCRIQRLEYQVRTALRVIGTLRGRALLSDEVGLGKTIEAGLILKEYLTRGMVKRVLVLTVPSLVDQWAEELNEKFDISVATTNDAGFRSEPDFWKTHDRIVASLHTVKQEAHLAIAQEVKWDLLIVDEAHYLRNRASQAWAAVNALPRQFLLLLTATPVQNSLEELYNLVTLLQPGQLPSPKEFRSRFIDKRKPHVPREPEELRRLLGQVMVRNTRANSGIHLPSRRAEVVLFDLTADERSAWTRFEEEFRSALDELGCAQASLWGRLLLQASGSSPHAWRKALQSFPKKEIGREWSHLAPFDASWQRKVELVLPLTKFEKGVVVFTQFIETQAALAEALRAAGAPVFVINGQTPPADRVPIGEEFRSAGGALILTHSGTEGRNLQFCHQLVNFDLPWNPMEIEQRIGRLHRIGQTHPVRIYNLVQAGSLQEHLLNILQEKLNLFELVVGETGLILGDRFSSDEFAEEVLKRWRESQDGLAARLEQFGDELAAARAAYGAVKALDETLFAKDYESL